MSLPIKTSPTGEILIDPLLIETDPNQPRRMFDQASLESLMYSIAEVGLIEPLVITMTPEPRFILVAGERRLRACLLGRKQFPDNPHFQLVPVRIRTPEDWTDLKRLRVQLDENRFREGLRPIEIAEAYRSAKLLQEISEAEQALLFQGIIPPAFPSGTPLRERERHLRQVLKQHGIPWPKISWTRIFAELGQPVDPRVMALLRISDPVLQRCSELGLSKTAAAALAALKDEARQMAVLDVVEEHQDVGLLHRMVDLMRADPALTAQEAAELVMDARNAVWEARDAVENSEGELSEKETDGRPEASEETFQAAADHLRAAAELMEQHRFSRVQKGSLRLLLERAERALCSGNQQSQE